MYFRIARPMRPKTIAAIGGQIGSWFMDLLKAQHADRRMREQMQYNAERDPKSVDRSGALNEKWL